MYFEISSNSFEMSSKHFYIFSNIIFQLFIKLHHFSFHPITHHNNTAKQKISTTTECLSSFVRFPKKNCKFAKHVKQ